MASQPEIAAHLDLSVPAVSVLMRELGLDWRALSLDEVRVIYIRRLRETAAGRSGDDQQRLTQARARDSAASADLKTVELAERLGRLVPAEEVAGAIEAAFAVVRNEMLVLEERLIELVESETGARINPELVRGLTRPALANLAQRADDAEPDAEAELADVSAAE